MSFDEYVAKYIDWDVKISRYILLFYSLPKTSLHSDFRSKFLDLLNTSDADLEKKLIDKLIENTLSAKYNELTKQEFFKDETRDLMYKPFKKIKVDDENLIYVWIPYDLIEKWKPNIKKWSYSEVISKDKTPIRYAFFDDRYLLKPFLKKGSIKLFALLIYVFNSFFFAPGKSTLFKINR